MAPQALADGTGSRGDTLRIAATSGSRAGVKSALNVGVSTVLRGALALIALALNLANGARGTRCFGTGIEGTPGIGVTDERPGASTDSGTATGLALCVLAARVSAAGLPPTPLGRGGVTNVAVATRAACGCALSSAFSIGAARLLGTRIGVTSEVGVARESSRADALVTACVPAIPLALSVDSTGVCQTRIQIAVIAITLVAIPAGTCNPVAVGVTVGVDVTGILGA